MVWKSKPAAIEKVLPWFPFHSQPTELLSHYLHFSLSGFLSRGIGEQTRICSAMISKIQKWYNDVAKWDSIPRVIF
jgi:hypothetical protein